jgi:hypothetical protein
MHLHEYLSPEFQASTADKLKDLHKRQHSPALLAALARAEEDFGEE